MGARTGQRAEISDDLKTVIRHAMTQAGMNEHAVASAVNEYYRVHGIKRAIVRAETISRIVKPVEKGGVRSSTELDAVRAALGIPQDGEWATLRREEVALVTTWRALRLLSEEIALGQIERLHQMVEQLSEAAQQERNAHETRARLLGSTKKPAAPEAKQPPASPDKPDPNNH